MKRLFLVSILALIAGVAAIGFGTTHAKEDSIAKNFGPNSILVAPASGEYKFDKAHSSIGFKVTHMGLIDVPGYFKDFTGAVNYNADNVEQSTVTFTAKTESVDTRVGGRDKHLRSADFFDVANHPEMTFVSTKVESNGNTLKVTGDFTLRGVKKSITFPVRIAGFKDGRRGTVMGAAAATKINRSEYNVKYGLGGAVSDEVRIELNIEARKNTAVKKEESK